MVYAMDTFSVTTLFITIVVGSAIVVIGKLTIAFRMLPLFVVSIASTVS
jgi:hypothetical protein